MPLVHDEEDDEYVIWEKHEHVVHDSPTPGIWSETELKNDRSGPYSSKKSAEKELGELIAKYQKEGYSRTSTNEPDNPILKKGPVEITLRIEKYYPNPFDF